MISTGSLLLGIALLLIVGLVVIRPLLSPSTEEATFAHAAAPVTMRQALEAQKDALLEQIRDLDFDHETGKVPEDRYRQRREKLAAEAADIFRQLDALAPAADGAGQEAHEVDDEVFREDEALKEDEVIQEDEIEAAVARLRKRPPVAGARSGTEAPKKDAEAEIEAAIASLRNRSDGHDGTQMKAEPAPVESRATDKRSRFCPQCGEPHDPDDKFCAYCGYRLD